MRQNKIYVFDNIMNSGGMNGIPEVLPEDYRMGLHKGRGWVPG
jgi:hypothetical protein